MPYDMTVTRDDIINAAFLDMGIYAPGETPTAEEVNNASLQLNMLIKNWEASGIGLWLVKRTWLVYEPGRQSYALGPGGDRFAMQMALTAVAVAAQSGASQIELERTTDITTGQYIGIATSTNTMHWTTVTGVSGSTVSLASPLPSAVDRGRRVFAYATTGPRPLDVVEARDVDASGYELSLNRIPYNDYIGLAAKSVSGRVTQFCYVPELTVGRLYVWPTSDSVERWLELTVRVPIRTVDAATDVPEFPAEWFAALHFNLARVLSAQYGVPHERYSIIAAEAAAALDLATGFDREQGVSVQFAVETRW